MKNEFYTKEKRKHTYVYIYIFTFFKISFSLIRVLFYVWDASLPCPIIDRLLFLVHYNLFVCVCVCVCVCAIVPFTFSTAFQIVFSGWHSHAPVVV